MFELLNDIKETYVMQLPQGQKRAYAKDIWYEEVKPERKRKKIRCENHGRKAERGGQKEKCPEKNAAGAVRTSGDEPAGTEIH